MRTGDTAVHLAASNGFSEVVYLLVTTFGLVFEVMLLLKV